MHAASGTHHRPPATVTAASCMQHPTRLAVQRPRPRGAAAGAAAVCGHGAPPRQRARVAAVVCGRVQAGARGRRLRAAARRTAQEQEPRGACRLHRCGATHARRARPVRPMLACALVPQLPCRLNAAQCGLRRRVAVTRRQAGAGAGACAVCWAGLLVSPLPSAGTGPCWRCSSVPELRGKTLLPQTCWGSRSHVFVTWIRMARPGSSASRVRIGGSSPGCAAFVCVMMGLLSACSMVKFLPGKQCGVWKESEILHDTHSAGAG